MRRFDRKTLQLVGLAVLAVCLLGFGWSEVSVAKAEAQAQRDTARTQAARLAENNTALRAELASLASAETDRARLWPLENGGPPMASAQRRMAEVFGDAGAYIVSLSSNMDRRIGRLGVIGLTVEAEADLAGFQRVLRDLNAHNPYVLVGDISVRRLNRVDMETGQPMVLFIMSVDMPFDEEEAL